MIIHTTYNKIRFWENSINVTSPALAPKHKGISDDCLKTTVETKETAA